jgi:hypothetical protein
VLVNLRKIALEVLLDIAAAGTDVAAGKYIVTCWEGKKIPNSWL